jgi:hypothetical protein
LGLPCLAGKCATPEHCEGDEQADPYDKALKWRGCPAKRTLERPEIRAALMLRSMGAVGPVSGWHERYTASVATTLVQIKAERQAMDAAQRGGSDG